jgi:hypothetical protein
MSSSRSTFQSRLFARKSFFPEPSLDHLDPNIISTSGGAKGANLSDAVIACLGYAYQESVQCDVLLELKRSVVLGLGCYEQLRKLRCKCEVYASRKQTCAEGVLCATSFGCPHQRFPCSYLYRRPCVNGRRSYQRHNLMAQGPSDLGVGSLTGIT